MLRPATHPFLAGFASLLLLHVAVQAAEPAWDCRATADGLGWQCYQDGEPAPPLDKAPIETPATAPDEQPQATPGAGAPAPQSAAPSGPTAMDATPAEPRPPAATASVALGSAAVTPGREQAAPPKTGPLPEPAARPVAAAATPIPTAADEPAPTKSTGPEPSAATPTDAASGAAAAAYAFHSSATPDLLTGEAAAPTAATMQTQAAVPTASTEPTANTAVVASGVDNNVATRIDQGIDWQSCALPSSAAASTPMSIDDSAATAPVEVAADAAVGQLEPEQVVFSGNVVLTQGVAHMQADELVLNRTTGEIDARGAVLLSRPDIRIAGSTAHYQLATGQGRIEQASYRVPAMRARGDAASAEYLGDGRSRYTEISYTTCQPGSSDWLLKAEALELDQAEGLGTAQHASLRFMGVPILYAPTFTFPIDDRRRSGLLIPAVGYSSNTGFDLSVPYYLNLAENYDLTLTPRLMSKRGALLGGEFRFLTESSNGTLAAEYLPNDRERGGNDARGSVSLQTHTQFDVRTESAVRMGYVSDSAYLEDLGDSLAITSSTHIERAGEMRYHGDTWEMLGRIQGFQTIDDAISLADRPYSRLPQLLVDLRNPDGVSGTTYHLAAEYVNFYKRDSVRGHRIDLFPALSLPLRESWGFIEPKVGARYTAYQLTDQTAGLSDSPSSLNGMFSLDSGLFFDRSTDYFGNAVTQTLEPRLFYLYVPSGSQADQPIFDTTEFDFSFDNLFRENRYNGPDRFGDANQVTLALTSRLLADDSGVELLRTSIGQILYFEDREVTLPGEPVNDNSTSAVVGEVAARLSGNWQTRAGIQWDPQDGSGGNIDQALAQLSYRDTQQRVFNVGYRLRHGITEQTDLAAIWPVSDKVSLIGRHNYSLRDKRLLEALAGIEYRGSCCWRTRALLRQYTDSTGNDHNLAFLVQLELNGLGRLGNDIDQTLERGIYGYRTDEND